MVLLSVYLQQHISQNLVVHISMLTTLDEFLDILLLQRRVSKEILRRPGDKSPTRVR